MINSAKTSRSFSTLSHMVYWRFLGIQHQWKFILIYTYIYTYICVYIYPYAYIDMNEWFYYENCFTSLCPSPTICQPDGPGKPVVGNMHWVWRTESQRSQWWNSQSKIKGPRATSTGSRGRKRWLPQFQPRERTYPLLLPSCYLNAQQMKWHTPALARADLNSANWANLFWKQPMDIPINIVLPAPCTSLSPRILVDAQN